MIKVSDFVFQYLEEYGVKHVFMLSGGGIMHLVDSLGRSKLDYICCHHEQAASIAAQAYAMYKNDIGVCLVTTGPGGTNALTGASAAYMDSTPVLFLSGQVKREDFASLRGVRQFGAQENNIISMVKPVTKYAEIVERPEDILYHLQKALYMANHGRKGPVWLDIPLDVQSAMIEENKLKEFYKDKEESTDPTIEVENANKEKEIEKFLDEMFIALQNAKRPLILAGHGVIASGAEDLFLKFQEKLKLPVVSTWRAAGVMGYEEPYFFGSPGLQANRYSNLITQGADFLIILGSRLDNMITAFNESHFACRAKKFIVDIDEKEVLKLHMTDTSFVICDIKKFLEIALERKEISYLPQHDDWLEFCKKMKKEYPLLKEKQEKRIELTNLYQLATCVSEYATKEDAIVISSTSRCNTAGYIAFKHKRGQKIISSMGLGSMGFALPSAIGAYFAAEKKRVIMLEGDGSFQLNIQELQTICTYGIQVKLFIWSNAGYAAITTMQDRNFDSFYVGSNPKSGVSMPDLEKIARAYEIPYLKISRDEEIDEMVKRTMESPKTTICEVSGDLSFDEIPKCISSVLSDGKRVSALLENPFPFLKEEEMKAIWAQLPE